jgi:hypothetical protein
MVKCRNFLRTIVVLVLIAIVQGGCCKDFGKRADNGVRLSLQTSSLKYTTPSEEE